MRAVRFSEYGVPTEVAQVVEVPMPEPGAGEVRIRLTHRAVNPADLLTMAGLYGRLPKSLPATLGFEGMGKIDKLGEGVTGLTVGQRVFPLAIAGSWQEYANCAAQFVLPVHDNVSDETAAQFLVNPVTAWVMLTEVLALQEGDWLVQTAAGSTLGRIILQIAKLKGYKTVNLVRREAQIQELLDLGGDAVFCTEDHKLVEKVRELTGGKGVKGGVEAVGGDTGAIAIHCLQPGGTLLLYGLLSGQPIPVDSGEMLFRGLTVKGYWLTHWFETSPPERTMAVMSELMQLMASGQIVPPVEATYDLGQVREAILHAETPGRHGKVILTG